MRVRMAQKLRQWADRLDHRGAPKMIGMSFTFEKGAGIVLHHGYGDRALKTVPDGGNFAGAPGCQLAYLGDEEYAKAHGL